MTLQQWEDLVTATAMDIIQFAEEGRLKRTDLDTVVTWVEALAVNYPGTALDREAVRDLNGLAAALTFGRDDGEEADGD